MPAFQYTAIDHEGNQIQGVILASNEDEGLQQLKKQTLIPIKLEEKTVKRTKSSFSHIKIKNADIASFTKQLQTLLKAGIPLVNCLNVLKKQTTDPDWEQIISLIAGDLYSYKEKEVNINLEVIPRINEGKKITLNVHPVLEEIIDYIGPADYPQPVTSKREVKTTVMVNSGETVVIGGLIKEMETKSVEKVWLLGDIPLLGYLFRHTIIKKEKKDLTIFITTRIMD
jgi:hypothetical protein